MVGRGALTKPWLFTEIKEQRTWDITAGERLEFLKDFVRYGLEHWGSDDRGVRTTRRFLLEWLSYLHRYVPVAFLEVLPPALHLRPPSMYGRTHLEALFLSNDPVDWLKIAEILLGPAPPGFTFTPKHASNSYAVTAKEMTQIETGDVDAAEGGAAEERDGGQDQG